MDLHLHIRRERDDSYFVHIPELPGVVSFGPDRDATLQEAGALGLRVIADQVHNREIKVPDLAIAFAIDELTDTPPASVADVIVRMVERPVSDAINRSVRPDVQFNVDQSVSDPADGAIRPIADAIPPIVDALLHEVGPPPPRSAGRAADLLHQLTEHGWRVKRHADSHRLLAFDRRPDLVFPFVDTQTLPSYVAEYVLALGGIRPDAPAI